MIQLDGPVQALLKEVVSRAAPLRVALVGGAVRDHLLHRVHNDPWLGLPDLDLVVEDPNPGAGPPAAHRIALDLQQQLGPRVSFCHLHEAFGTAEIEIDRVLLDLATARREHYPEAGSNPIVHFGSLEDDLSRRDLSINAIALVLSGSPSNAERLIDPFDGQLDLASRELRFLHAGSVRDDPTRVIRAARYGARLAMELTAESLRQLQNTLEDWPWRNGNLPSLGTRLRMELEILLGREPWPRALALLQQWGALVLLAPQLQEDRECWRRLHRAQRLSALAQLPPWPPEQWLLLALLASLDNPLPVADRLQLSHRSHHQLGILLRLRQWLDQARTEPSLRPSALSMELERHGFSPEAVVLALASQSPGAKLTPRLRRGLLRWLLRWRKIKADLGATDLMAQGLAPGPRLGERLRELRAERLDRENW